MIYLKIAESEYFDDLHLQKTASKALYELLYSAFGKKYTDEDIKLTKGGKPYIENAGFDFSVSHTKGAVAAAAVGHGEKKENLICIDKNADKIGVDIESAEREVKGKERIIKKLFSEAEKEYIKSDINRRFLEIWTKKESIVKATGKGLSGISTADTYSFNGKYIDTRYVNIGDKEYIVSIAII